MTNKQLLFGTTVIGLSLAIASAGIASAAPRGNGLMRFENGPRAEVHQALDNNDYAAWVQALSGHEKVPFDLNESTFGAFQKAHELMQQGDKDGAKEVLESAGVQLPPLGQKMGRGHGHQNNPAVREAIEANDYTAWQTAIAETKLSDIASQDLFNKMVEVHSLRESGDRDAARQSAQELRELIRTLKSQ